jgi:hypothetical protein
MPNINLTIPEIDQSVSRPVIFDIINQLQEITKIDKTTEIFYPGDIQKMRTPGTSIDDKNIERFARFNTEKYNFIDVEEDFDINTLGSTAVSGHEQIPIFLDRSLNIIIKPIYATSNVKINFKYRCTSKTEAIRWRNDMRLRVSANRDINLHNITYHYLIPLELIELLRQVHIRRELTEPYSQTFEEYVKSNITDRLNIVGDIVNNDCRLSISETQCRIIGLYDFIGISDKPERDEDNGCYTISFSYKFNYEKPIGCNIRYPVMIHNTLLPERYTTFNNLSYDLDKVDKSYSMSLHALNNFESDTTINKLVDVNGILHIPYYDDFQLDESNTATGTGTVFLALSEVDVLDKRTLINLKELGNITIDDDILDFILNSELPYVTNLYTSIINISLYRNKYLTNSKSLICDNNLNIKATSNLSLRNEHRIRFSLVTDLTLLSKDALDRLRKYPLALIKIISALNELLRNNLDFINLGNNKHITELDFNNMYRVLTGYNYANNKAVSNDFYYGPGRNADNSSSSQYGLFGLDPNLLEIYRNQRIGMNTVQLYSIIAILKNT